MGAGLGNLFGGLMDGIGQGLAKRKARQNEMKDVAFKGALQSISQLANNPNFAGDPAALEDLQKASMAVIADYTGHGEKVKNAKGKEQAQNPLTHAQQLIGGIMQKVYPSGIPQSTEVDPIRQGPIRTPDEVTDLKQAEAKQKSDAELAKFKQQEVIRAQTQQKIERAKQRMALKSEFEEETKIYDYEVKRGTPPEEALKISRSTAFKYHEPVENEGPPTQKEMFGPNGEQIFVFRNSKGKWFGENNEPVDVTAMKLKGWKFKDKDEADKGTKFNEWKTILRSQHPEWEHDRIEKEAGLKAAAQIAEETDAKRTRLNITLQNAANRTSAVADAPDIAQAIMNGEQPPDSAGLSRSGAWMKIRGDLAKKGFNLTKAELDWKAAQRYVATLNGSQQVRIREAASTVSQMLPDIRNKYDTWRKAGLASGIKIFNRAALVASKNLPGPAGVAAQALETQIADMVAELGQLYMGGNSPTDHSLKLAEQNLKGDWTPEQFNAALDLLKNNLSYRVNSIMNAGAAGMSEGSPYMPTGGEGVKTQPTTQPTNAADYLKRIRGK